MLIELYFWYNNALLTVQYSDNPWEWICPNHLLYLDCVRIRTYQTLQYTDIGSFVTVKADTPYWVSNRGLGQLPAECKATLLLMNIQLPRSKYA